MFLQMRFELPNTFGIGFMWNHDNRLKIGVDYQLQKWAKIKYPQLDIMVVLQTIVLLVDNLMTFIK